MLSFPHTPGCGGDTIPREQGAEAAGQQDAPPSGDRHVFIPLPGVA